jgi:tetratricopeptide (TPR) repeat protein
MLGDEPRADDLWRTLYSHAQLDTGHALFAASTLYAWGRIAEAEILWWRAADQEGGNAIQALGALARHYQVTRDADGQYRAFRRLHLLQPQDADIANNFAFFGLLLGREDRLAAHVAQANFEKNLDNDGYLATQAFALVQQDRAAEAVKLLQPKAAKAADSPGLGFAYGLALGKTGRKSEARALLERLPPASLTTAEMDLIKSVLAD